MITNTIKGFDGFLIIHLKDYHMMMKKQALFSPSMNFKINLKRFLKSSSALAGYYYNYSAICLMQMGAAKAENKGLSMNNIN